MIHYLTGCADKLPVASVLRLTKLSTSSILICQARQDAIRSGGKMILRAMYRPMHGWIPVPHRNVNLTDGTLEFIRS